MNEIKIATDWEGPWVTNDFAYEVCSKLYSPQFFEKLSNYDDYLAYVVKKPEYEPGNTLKLIAPFLVAKNVTSDTLKQMSKPKYLKKAFSARKALNFFNLLVVSTAYEQFLEVSCLDMDFRGTNFKPEKYEMDEEERKYLIEVSKLIPEKDYEWLDHFFWKEMKKLKTSWEILNDVKVTGGIRKKEIAEEFEANVCVGDSISDSKMLEWVSKDGLAISFNGNKYALEKANVAVISDSVSDLALIIHIYAKKGISGVKTLCEAKDGFYYLPELKDKELEEVVRKSEKMRKLVRGNAGKLG